MVAGLKDDTMAAPSAEHGMNVTRCVKDEKKLAKKGLKDWKKQMKQTEKEMKKEMKNIGKAGHQKIIQQDALTILRSMTDKEIDTLVNNTKETKLQDVMKEFQKYVPIGGTSPIDKLKAMLRFAFKSLAGKGDDDVPRGEVEKRLQLFSCGMLTAESDSNKVVQQKDDVILRNEIQILREQLKGMVPSGHHEKLKFHDIYLKKKVHKFKSERDHSLQEKNRLKETVSDLKYAILLEKEGRSNAEIANVEESKKYEKYRKLYHQLQSTYDAFSNKAIVEQRRLLFEFGYKLQNGTWDSHQLELKEMQEKLIKVEIKLKEKDINENGVEIMNQKEKHIKELIIDLKKQQASVLNEHIRCKEEEKVRFLQQELRIKELFQHKREEYYALKEKLDVENDRDEIDELELKIQKLSSKLKEKEEKIKDLMESNEMLMHELCSIRRKSGKMKKDRKETQSRTVSKDRCWLCKNQYKVVDKNNKNGHVKKFFGIKKSKKEEANEKEQNEEIGNTAFQAEKNACKFCHCEKNWQPTENKKLSTTDPRRRKSIQQQIIQNPDFKISTPKQNEIMKSKKQQIFLIKEIERAVRYMMEEFNKINPSKKVSDDRSVQERILSGLMANVARVKKEMQAEVQQHENNTVYENECEAVKSRSDETADIIQQHNDVMPTVSEILNGKDDTNQKNDGCFVQSKVIPTTFEEVAENDKKTGGKYAGGVNQENQDRSIGDDISITETKHDGKCNSGSEMSPTGQSNLFTVSEAPVAGRKKKKGKKKSCKEVKKRPIITTQKEMTDKIENGQADEQDEVIKDDTKVLNDVKKKFTKEIDDQEEIERREIRKLLNLTDSSSDEDLSKITEVLKERGKGSPEIVVKKKPDDAALFSSQWKSTCIEKVADGQRECGKKSPEIIARTQNDDDDVTPSVSLDELVAGRRKKNAGKLKKKRPIWMTWEEISDEGTDTGEKEIAVVDAVVEESVENTNIMQDIREKKLKKENQISGNVDTKCDIKDMKMTGEKKISGNIRSHGVGKATEQNASVDVSVNDNGLLPGKVISEAEKKESSLLDEDFDIDFELANISYVPTIFEGTKYGLTGKKKSKITFHDMVKDLVTKPTSKIVKEPPLSCRVSKTNAEIQKSMDEIFTTDLQREASLRSERQKKQLSKEETEFLNYIPTKKFNTTNFECADLFEDEFKIVKRQPKCGRRYQA